MTNWIWIPSWTEEDAGEPCTVQFRKTLTLENAPLGAEIRISADTRYKLYINGKLVQTGPSRGDHQIWFQDVMDVAGELKAGVNVIAVSVLRYPEDTDKGNHGMFRTKTPGLFFKGTVEEADGKKSEIAADASWKCRKEEKRFFIREEEGFAPLIIHEKAEGDPAFSGWMNPDFDASDWAAAREYAAGEPAKVLLAENLKNRTIPFMYRKRRCFAGVMDDRKSVIGKKAWEEFLEGESSGAELIIPADTLEEITISAGEEMTGLMHTEFIGGPGAAVEYFYSECYVYDERTGAANLPVKKNRIDKEKGHLEGYRDLYTVGGFGTGNFPEVYDPYWYRTFRFIRLIIRTGNQPLILKCLDYEETGYPLEVKTCAKTSDETLKAVWEISERTLRRCMYETYMDCPFYEQLQYAMDARQEILYTYSVSADDRLARKCMDDLKRSQRPDGLLNCNYPNCNVNVIPGFSMYYILMVYDHMMYFGDKNLIAEHLPVIERILKFFHDRLTPEGYVGKIGTELMKSVYWSFIDWAKEWDATSGMPPAGVKGPITAESLLYVYGLQHAAKLLDYMEEEEKAGVLRAEAAGVQKAIRRYCMDEDGCIEDGPGIREYSQYVQVLAVLTDTVDAETGRRILKRTVEEPEKFAQCTIATGFYLFRALEKTGLYERTDQCWEKWRQMIRNHSTTCTESENFARSECHAWGSVILYELPSVTLGVRPLAPGYQKTGIAPVPGYMTSASGTVCTPKGDVRVSWTLENGQLKLNYTAPEGAEVVVED